MDCLSAREILSEAFDRGIEKTPLAAEARVHCRGCAECATFAAGLASLRNMPGPRAPEELVDAILERTRRIAELDTAAAENTLSAAAQGPAAAETAAAGPEAAPVAVPAPISPAVRPPQTRDAWWWGWRVAGALAAAAVVLFAVALAYQGFRSIGRTGGPAASAPTAVESVPLAAAPASATPYATDKSAAPSLGAAAAGAKYVSYNDQAFVWLGVRQPDSAGISLGGTLTSSLDTADTPRQYNVWQSKDDADLIFIQPSPEATGYAAFRRVMRTLGGKPFALASSSAQLSAYGQWPALPSNFATPTAADGTPTFVEAGKDDSGLTIYAPQGASPDAGFAIAPGTNVTDPAAGDPFWTWWVPKH